MAIRDSVQRVYRNPPCPSGRQSSPVTRAQYATIPSRCATPETLKGRAEAYLPLATVYADDVTLPTHNSKAGELLALQEFNDSMLTRQIEPHDCFETWRIFRRPDWLKQIRFLHVMDHPKRAVVTSSTTKRYLEPLPDLGDPDRALRRRKALILTRVEAVHALVFGEPGAEELDRMIRSQDLQLFHVRVPGELGPPVMPVGIA